MTLEEQCNLSYFIPIATINEDHKVFLVQHAINNRIYVKKTLQYYNLQMMQSIQENPIPNMPRIYFLFEENDCLHIIEEYISGQTLEDIITDNGPLSEEVAVSYVHQLCHIVNDLHNRKPPIIHRDIKPSNIIITPDNNLKLLDLSAAKISDFSKNQDTVLMGTAGYAAPEQYGFTSSSILTDIYSIGVLMNRMLTGEMLNTNRYHGPLESIINKCTQLNPSERYSSIDELEMAITDITDSNICHNHHIKSPHDLLVYMPPGFRSGKILPSLFALVGYIFMFSVTFSISVNKPTPQALIVNRIGATVAILAIIFFSGNYMNCQTLLPLSKSENKTVKVLGIILWDFIIFILIVLLIATLEG